MALTAPNYEQLFDGLPAEQRLDRFEAYKAALSACHQKTAQGVRTGSISWGGQSIVKNATVSERIGELKDVLNKSMSADQIADITSALDRVSDVTKAGSEWTLTNPLNNSNSGVTGLVPYDLDPALSLLVPRSFILRNSTSRIGGIGQAYEFRRILGVSNSNTGGVANMNTFFNPTGASATFGGVTLNRPSKISYAADKIVLSHSNQGVSDQVDLTAQFAGQGYTDLRQLSHTSAIWAHMLGEERNMLNSVSTAVNVASTSAVASAAAASTPTGLPSATATAVYVTFSSALGESKAITATGTVTTSSGNTGVSLAITNVPYNSVAVNTYVNFSGTYYKGTTVFSNGTSPTVFVTVAALPSTSADNGSYVGGIVSGATGYDGFINTLSNPANSPASIDLNAALSTTEPGGDFQSVFYNLYQNVIADPDMILTTASIRRALAKSIQQQGTPTGYRLNYQTGSDGVTIGSVVTAIQNESTGKMVDVVAHPYMPAGVALVHSKALPFPDSGVSETVQVVNVQDMLVLEWPQIQLSWDISTYQYGTLAFRAPAWSAAITNINN
jgi:hypothetical protein